MPLSPQTAWPSWRTWVDWTAEECFSSSGTVPRELLAEAELHRKEGVQGVVGGRQGAVVEAAASEHCLVEEVVEEASCHPVEVEEVEGAREDMEDQGWEDLREHWLLVSRNTKGMNSGWSLLMFAFVKRCLQVFVLLLLLISVTH